MSLKIEDTTIETPMADEVPGLEETKGDDRGQRGRLHEREEMMEMRRMILELESRLAMQMAEPKTPSQDEFPREPKAS